MMAKQKSDPYTLTLPEGEYYIAWDDMVVGASMFIPCLSLMDCKRGLRNAAKKLGMQISAQTAIENNLLGVRIWRTL